MRVAQNGCVITQPHNRTHIYTHVTQALQGVQLMIESKILQSKQNEIGVILFGTEGTGRATTPQPYTSTP